MADFILQEQSTSHILLEGGTDALILEATLPPSNTTQAWVNIMQVTTFSVSNVWVQPFTVK